MSTQYRSATNQSVVQPQPQKVKRKPLTKDQAAQKIYYALKKWKLMRQEFIQALAQKMLQSKSKIIRSFRRYQIRKWTREGFLKIRIYWETSLGYQLNKAKLNETIKIFIVGNFSQPSWEKRLELMWSQYYGAFFIDLMLPRNAQFKFIVNDKFQTSPYYPIIKDGHFTNNTYFQIPQLALRNANIGSLYKVKQPSSEKNKQIKELVVQLNSGLQEQQTQVSQFNNLQNKLKNEIPKTCENSAQQNQANNGQSHIKYDKKILVNSTKSDIYKVYDCNKEGDQVSTQIIIRKQEEVVSCSSLGHQSYQYSRRDSISSNEDDHLVFIGDAFNISKNPQGPSEDAYFLTDKGLGVSDGVGGWNSYGIDSSLFSTTLMKECQHFIQRVIFRQQQSLIDPRITLQELECHRQALETSLESFSSVPSSDSDNSFLSQYQPGGQRNSGSTNSLFNMQTKHLCPTNILKFSLRRTQYPGSATASICVLNNRDMTALNLGDSGFLLIRFDSVTSEPYILIRSKEQIHGFNTPYQLTRLPTQKEVDNLRIQNKKRELESLKRAMKERKFCEDAPEDSDIYQMRIREGDLLILATDGVFDNLFQDEILQIVKKFVRNNAKTKAAAHLLARQIAEAAFNRSKQTNVKTPFQMKKAQLILDQKSKQKVKEKFQELYKQYCGMIDDEDIKQEDQYDHDFEKLSYGKGKPDDITAIAAWIQHRQSKQLVSDVYFGASNL